MKKMISTGALGVLLAVCTAAWATQPSITNSGFERYVLVGNPAKATADKGFGCWQAGENKRIPNQWILNLTSPGRLNMVVEDKAPEGKTYLKVTADVDVKHKRAAHLYSAVTGMEVGKHYRFSAKMRHGKAAIGLYEYKQNKSMRVVTVAMDECADEWREVSGFYTVPKDFRNAYFVVMVPWQSSVEIDDIQVREVAASEMPKPAEAAVFENEFMKLRLDSNGRLGSFYCKADKTEYAFPQCADSICQVNYHGTLLRANGFVRRGSDILELQFPDPAVKVGLRIKAQKRYFVFEVAQVAPDNLVSMSLEFPLRKLDRKSTITAANFSKTFVANLFALDFIPFCTVRGGKDGSMRIAADFLKQHGYAGGKIALLGMPRSKFFDVAKDVEKDYHLPAPKLNGKWLRESDNIRRSYLLVTAMQPGDLDKLIEYARIGNFQTIVFDKDQWLKTHGHYQINEKNFPGGLSGFKVAADRIHAAGLKVGVHIFGPSISSNDSYVSPIPDKRLSCVNCSPLVEDMDEADSTVTLAKRPSALQPAGFPENHLLIGDEIIRYGKFEQTPDKRFRFVNCMRGAYGTRAVPHKAGSEVKGLITKLQFFMLKPQTQLLDEVAGHFAKIVNTCGIDLVYVDASDAEAQARPMGYDLRRYVDQCHYTFYRKFDHDVLYQTSVGLGFNMQWHIVARGASANGFGDIKKLLAKHMRIITYAEHFAFADVGWYGLDPAIRVNAMEYIASKCLACDGSISIQGSRQSWDSHPQGREIFEMLSRYEACRVSRAFPQKITELLLDKDKDFRLYGSKADGWTLFEANMTADQFVSAVDGKNNVWTVENKFGKPAGFALEILRYPAYRSPNAVVLEDFTSLLPLKMGVRDGSYHHLIPGDNVLRNAHGVYTKGMRPNLAHSAYPVYYGTISGQPTIINDTEAVGFWAFGKTFAQPMDLSKNRHLAFWLRSYKTAPVDFDIQLIDQQGKSFLQSIKLDYLGWKLLYFDLPKDKSIDLSKVKHLVMTIRNVPPHTRDFRCVVAGVLALPGVQEPDLKNMELLVNGKSIKFPMALPKGATLTTDSLGNCTIWPGGMKAGRSIRLPASTIKLAPGKNTIEFRYKTGAQAGSDAIVRLIPLKKIGHTKGGK